MQEMTGCCRAAGSPVLPIEISLPCCLVGLTLQEIDRLLSGGGIEQQASELWGVAFGTATDNFNAFVERSAEDESTFQLASGGGSAASTPKFGGAAAAGSARGGSGDWGRPQAEETPWFNGGGGLEAQPSAAQQAAAEAGGAAKAIGTGTVLHTFVGDYNQPEELSVFEGDKVRPACTLVRQGFQCSQLPLAPPLPTAPPGCVAGCFYPACADVNLHDQCCVPASPPRQV